MTARDDLDRRLAAWFATDAASREPEHLLDQVLARTARTRRRPAWRVPERWLPVSAFTSRAATAPRASMRLVVALVLLVLALIVGAVLLAGSQPPRGLPAPFGPAANGLIAYAAEGDIYTLDLGTGQAAPVVAGPDVDTDPVWSLDGTQLAFVRTVAPDGGQLYVTRPDGTDPRAVTPVLPGGIRSVSFSPDGREVLFESGAPSRILIAKADGSGQRTLDLPLEAFQPTYRPPAGNEITVLATTSGGWVGVYAVNASGSGFRTLIEPSRTRTASSYQWSPDGSLLAYSVADFSVQEWTVQVHVMAADGSGDRTLPAPVGALWSDYGTWSNDGTHLVIERGYSPYGTQDIVAAVVPVDGSGPGVETGHRVLLDDADGFRWAPDDTSILLMPHDPRTETLQPLVIDPQTGETMTRPGSWSTTSLPSWQRLAP